MMKRFLLLGAWLLSAVCALQAATTEYPLWIQNVQVTSDNRKDVLGDGSVWVVPYSSYLSLYFKDANISISGAGKHAVRFDADDKYKELSISIEGTNEFTCESATAFQFPNGGEVSISGDEKATINIHPRAHAFYFGKDGRLTLGYSGANAFTMNIIPLEKTNLAAFCGYTDNVKLRFLSLNADIKVPAGKPITTGISDFTLGESLKLKPEGVKWAKTLKQFQLNGQELTDELIVEAPAPVVNRNFEIQVYCDPAKGNVSTSGMTMFSESQLYHMSGEEIMFDALDFTLSATPAEGYEFLGWVDDMHMVKLDDESLNTPEKVIAMMQESLDGGMQTTDPRYSVYTALLNADAKFTSESFYDYLTLYDDAEGMITFTAVFAEKATTEVGYVCDFTKAASKHSAYGDNWTYDTDWEVFGAANNNGQWEYAKFGGKSATIASANPVYVADNKAFGREIKQIRVTFPSGSFSKTGMSANEWGAKVYSDLACTQLLYTVTGGDIDKEGCVLTLTPESGKPWEAGSVIRVYWDLANTTSTNGIVLVEKIEYLTAIGDTNPLWGDEGQGIEEVPGDQVPSTKVLRDGTLYIIRPDGKVYNAQGARVK